MHHLRTHHNHPQGKIFAWMALILAFGIGLIFPIFPNFIKSIVHTDFAVSVFYSAMAIVMFLAALGSTLLFKKVQRTTITKVGFITTGIVFFLLIFATRLTEVSLLETVRIWFEMILLIALALFVRDFSHAYDLGEEEGQHYRFQNIGQLIGPLLGGFLAIQFGYEVVFITAAIVIFAGFAYFYHKHIIQKHPAIINLPRTTTKQLTHNIRDFFRNSERAKAYLITLTFMLWTSFKRIYIPLYVVISGYLESMSGLILALAILPLILMEVRIGEYGDLHGLKKPISIGFLIMALSLATIFFSPFVLVNFLILVLLNIGAAMIEPLQEVLVFRNISHQEEEDLYGIYMTADPLAFFVTPLIGLLILLFLPFKFLFLVFGIIMLGMSFFAHAKIRH